MTPEHSYWLCVTPRSGSSLLCQVMAACGVLGNPQEYGLADNMPAAAKSWGLSAKWGTANFRDYWARCLEEGTSSNGWFGMKMAPATYLDTFLSQVRTLPAYADKEIEMDDLIREFFGDLRLIFLTRRDKLRQAVSMLKALQINLWSSEQGRSHGIEPGGQLVYDRAAIDSEMRLLALAEARWQDFFTRWNVQPLTLVYEDYQHDYEGTVARIVDYLGVQDPYALDASQISLTRLADDVTEEWVARYWSKNPLGSASGGASE